MDENVWQVLNILLLLDERLIMIKGCDRMSPVRLKQLQYNWDSHNLLHAKSDSINSWHIKSPSVDLVNHA